MQIPRHIRFVWSLMGGPGEVPESHRRYLNRWIELHDAWEITVHKKRAILDVVARYPEYPFACYERDIQRADACRPMLLHRYGGVYCDLDVEPHRCLDRLSARYPRANVLLGVETVLSRKESRWVGREMAIRKGIPEVRRRIANYFIASVPGHPFWLETLELIKARAGLPVKEQYDVLYTTGPGIVSEVAEKNAGTFKDVKVVPKRVLDRFITHHCVGGWRDFQVPAFSHVNPQLCRVWPC